MSAGEEEIDGVLQEIRAQSEVGVHVERIAAFQDLSVLRAADEYLVYVVQYFVLYRILAVKKPEAAR